MTKPNSNSVKKIYVVVYMPRLCLLSWLRRLLINVVVSAFLNTESLTRTGNAIDQVTMSLAILTSWSSPRPFRLGLIICSLPLLIVVLTILSSPSTLTNCSNGIIGTRVSTILTPSFICCFRPVVGKSAKRHPALAFCAAFSAAV